jgi:hypothetical protein
MLSPAESGVEELVLNLVLWLKLAVEASGAVVIGIGVLVAGVRYLQRCFEPGMAQFNAVGSVLPVSGIGAGIAAGGRHPVYCRGPSWDQIGKLAAIAVLRTALNFFWARKSAIPSRRVKPVADQP